MNYEIEILSGVDREIKKLPEDIQGRLTSVIDSLASTPRPKGAKKLKAAGDCYRIREGDYRIVYAVFDDRLVVLLLRVGHRKEVYEHVINLVKQRLQSWQNSQP